MAALVALLRTLPVLHADETTDRVGTATVWLHVVSTGRYTLIHASATRASEAIDEAGGLPGYRGVIVHDRLAMYWKLKAKHGLYGAHLLRDLADVAGIATQTSWASGLAALLVEISAACDDAGQRGLRQLAPGRQRAFAARYDALVADAIAANPQPSGRSKAQRAAAPIAQPGDCVRHASPPRPALHVRPPCRLHQQPGRTDLRPTKLHRKISGWIRSQHGAEHFAALHSDLSTTRKNGVPAIDVLTRLFNGNPWMPPHET
ncbi:MAG: transposase [Actinobacteria bacterium]|nr:transposase [Actinomycetota bacterium]